jgi:ribosomal protein L16 Arg81 hydroxylase
MLTFDISASQFRADYFEKSVRLQKGALRSQPLAWTDLDQLLGQIELAEPAIKLFNRGLIPTQAYVEETIELGQRRRRLHKARFYGQMRNGATLVINRFESHSQIARRLCAQVASFARLQSTSNAYLSFGGQGTFGKHWDTHDVFAIQLIGRKRWQVFEPTFPLPLSFQTSEGVAPDQVSHPVLDCVLEAGDVLYVPRGWWHQTLPLEEGSFHLSVGTYAATLHDYLLWVCSRCLPSQQAARRAFDPSADDDEVLAELSQHLGEALRNPAAREAFGRELAQRERLSSEFRLGLFVDPASKGLCGTELIRLTSFDPQPFGRPEVLVNGARLELDPVSHAVVATVRDSALVFDVLCARLGEVPRDRLQRAVLDLAQHELVTIEDRSAERLP